MRTIFVTRSHTLLGTRSQRGATLVEAALVLPIFFLLLLGFIDVAFFFGAKALLFHGAQRALNLAQKLPNTDVDLNSITDTDAKYGQFIAARQQIVNRALELPSMLVAIPPSTGLITIQRLQNVDALFNGSRQVATSVLFIRPGERAFDPSTGTFIEHPTLCSAASTCITKRQPTDQWATILRSHPIIVEFRCDYRPLMFFLLGRINFRVTVAGYREAAGSATG